MTVFNTAFFKLAEGLLVLMLTAMVIMVFGNVVLRYGFNSGLDYSEELSRFLFIWITFLGAIIGMREKAHLGLDTLLRALPTGGKKWCFGISHLMMLGCCVLMFYGTWKQHHINATTSSPVVGIKMIWVYGVGYLASISMGLIVLGNLLKLVKGEIEEGDLIQIHESEEALARIEADSKGPANTVQAKS